MNSKIVIFLLYPMLFFVFPACNDKDISEHIIPDIDLYISINLNNADAQELKNNNQPVYFSHYSGRKIGVWDNGIVVMKFFDSDYVCCDASCTRCLESGAIVKPVKGKLATVTCRKCATEFIVHSGAPVKNEENQEKIYPLKQYNVSINGNSLTIRNERR